MFVSNYNENHTSWACLLARKLAAYAAHVDGADYVRRCHPQMIEFISNVQVAALPQKDGHIMLTVYLAAGNQPGPGAYSPTASATSPRKAAFSMCGRPQTANAESFTPGPGQYKTAPTKTHVGTHPNSSSYTFGLKTLADKEAERKPGPAGRHPVLCSLFVEPVYSRFAQLDRVQLEKDCSCLCVLYRVHQAAAA